MQGQKQTQLPLKWPYKIGQATVQTFQTMPATRVIYRGCRDVDTYLPYVGHMSCMHITLPFSKIKSVISKLLSCIISYFGLNMSTIYLDNYSVHYETSDDKLKFSSVNFQLWMFLMKCNNSLHLKHPTIYQIQKNHADQLVLIYDCRLKKQVALRIYLL